MLRWQTAGESHGEALVAMIEGLPAGVRVTSDDVVDALARRRLAYGRGARMKFEQDKVRLLTGVRFGAAPGITGGHRDREHRTAGMDRGDERGSLGQRSARVRGATPR